MTYAPNTVNEWFPMIRFRQFSTLKGSNIMTKRTLFSLAGASLMLLASCTQPETPKNDEPKAPPPRPAGAYHVYVTNERSGDLTIIDSVTNDVVSTVKLGKRPRGIHVSPDKKTI